MPIPFHDADDVAKLGLAGYLKIDAQPAGVFRGALFLVNARGEPVEFTFNRVETPNTFLWRREDVYGYAARTLVSSLFSTCPRVPQLLLCLAEEVPAELFSQEIQVAIPVCRIASLAQAVAYSPSEARERSGTPEAEHLFWYPAPPEEGSMERGLASRLITGGLLVEPFKRAEAGLREVYDQSGFQAG